MLFAIAFRCALNHRRRKMFRPGGRQGRSQDFFYRGEGNFGQKGRSPNETRRAESRVGFLRRMQSTPPHQLGNIFRVVSPGSLVLFIVPCKGRIFPVLIILGVYWYNFHSSNLCQGRNYERQLRRLPRLPQWTLRHWRRVVSG